MAVAGRAGAGVQFNRHFELRVQIRIKFGANFSMRHYKTKYSRNS